MDQKYYYKELLNGINLLLISIPGTKLATVEMRLKCGYLYEKKEQREYAHFVEHIQAKYTSTKYPNALENLQKFESRALTRNASTSFYKTNYWLSGNTKELDFMLDIFINSFINFQLDEENFEKEKKAIIIELNDRRLTDFDIFAKQIFYRGSNLNDITNIDGRINSINKAKPSDILEFRKMFYSTRNFWLCVCGDFEIKTIYKKIVKLVTNTQHLDYRVPKMNYIKYNITNPEFHYYPSTDNHIIVTFYINYETRDKILIDMIINVLRDRLFKILRYEKNIIYDVYPPSFESFNNGVSYIQYQIETNHYKSIMICLETMLKQIKILKKKLLPKDELDRIKNVYMNKKYEEGLNHKFHKYIDRYVTQLMENNLIVKGKYDLDFSQTILASNLLNISKSIFKKRKMQIIYTGEHDLTDDMKKLFTKTKKN